MATTVQSRFLAISATPPNVNTGWQIHVLDYKDLKTPVAILSEFSAFSFTQQLNDPGTGSVTIDLDSPWWTTRLNNGVFATTLLDNEYVFEAWESGARRFAWVAQTVENTIIGEDETRAVTISGPGIAQVLTWACIMRPGWPKKPPITDTIVDGSLYRRTSSYNDLLPAYIWQFPMRWSSMRMWYTVFKAAQRRGLCRMVTPTFTATADSAKQTYVWIKTVDEIADQHGYQPAELNESLLDFLNECTGQDYTKWFGQRLEWLMYPGFRLDVRRQIGTDRSKTVRFYDGQIISNTRTRDREQIFNRVTAVDVDGVESIRTDASSVKAWNLREQRNETNKNVTDNTLRGQLADRYIQQSSSEQSQWSIKIPYDDPDRIPYHNFYVGDSVMLDGAKYRVKAISISLAADQTVPDCELTLQSILDLQADSLQKQITRLINDPRQFSLSDIKDISIPALPKTKSGLVYNTKTKKWEAEPITTSTSTGDTGTGGGGPRVYMQSADPTLDSTNTVDAGDFWLETYD